MRAALSIALPALLLAASAPAQTGGGGQAGGLLSQLGGGQNGGLLGSLGGGGGLGGALGSAGIGNVTGLLGYCVKNQLLGGAAGGTGATGGAAGGAAGLLGKLTAKPGVATSGGFLAGQQGVLQSGGRSLPLGSLGDAAKQPLCRAILSRAQGLLGR